MNRTKAILNSFIRQQQMVILALASLTGALSGLAAAVLRIAIAQLNMLSSSLSTQIGLIAWVVTPAAGALLSGLIVSRFAHETGGHGVPEVMESYVLRDGRIRPRVPLVKTITAALTIGSGGSAGQEGPISQIGSGVGSALAQRFRLDKKATRTLVVCGTSSGIAAIFGAPLGGTIFGIEILVGELTAISAVPVILASVVSVAVMTTIIGDSSSPFVTPPFVFTNVLELLFYLVLGIASGVLSKGWVRLFYLFEGLFSKAKFPTVLKPCLGAALTGVLGVIAVILGGVLNYEADPLESVSLPAVMGDGYAFINSALLGKATLVALVVFAVMKMFATSFSVGSGGSGGIFAPTLFIGAGLGGAFGMVFHWAAPWAVENPMAYALVGMAAVFAGAAHVPVTCIVLIMEVTGGYHLILPLMVAVSSSFVVSSAISTDSIYTVKLRRRGILLRRGVYIDALRSVRASAVMTVKPVVLRPEMTTSEALRVVRDTHHTKFPVVDDRGTLVGTVITEVLENRCDASGCEYRVSDLMTRDYLVVPPSASIDEVLHLMMQKQEGHAVVMDPAEPGRMVGFLTKTDVFRAYESAVTLLKMKGAFLEDYLGDTT
ncbi:MAG: chloride channel protein [Candidatus Thorarchaeota archaeon]|nr:chloride channel protein [Candidatus Thorarchaeota archaeon]